MMSLKGTNNTPVTGQIIHVISHLPVIKLIARYIAVIIHQNAPYTLSKRFMFFFSTGSYSSICKSF